ncbi:hypothetical protein M433DRAFT_8045 [Acidomyces richmondensis BFW]|nr:MAG: hypothetical protein FE78DRAFT_29068 [Acidomyces sp. 'richmondensis']KYG41322.1 hypothetical protein M433DRAFT_8045 [Acidomyces richmondensis BFW]
MAKRKRAVAAARTNGSAQGPPPEADASLRRVRDYEDVADSEDEFHIQREQVLLGEGRAAKRRRQREEREEFLSEEEEEVLGYSEAEEAGEDDDDDGDGDDSDDNDDGAEGGGYRGGMRRAADGTESTDEGGNNDDGDDDDEYGWATSKADLYGADEIETEEQALAEEAEALRLQKKQLQSLTAADYGFDEAEWHADGKDMADHVAAVTTEVLPPLHIPDTMGVVERQRLLKNRYPEFEALAGEFLHMRGVYAALVRQVEERPADSRSGVVVAKSRAAAAYVGSLAMYFALLASPAASQKDGVVATAMSASQLREHPVMASLMRSRDLWLKVQDLEASSPQQAAPAPAEGSFAADGAAVSTTPVANVQPQPPKTKTNKTRAERHAAAALAAKTAHLARAEDELADLQALVAASASATAASRRPGARAHNDSGSDDLGEEMPWTARDAEEKARRRRKTLGFYTSQIAQKAQAHRREGGGDDDVPHRERLKDRQARLNAAAERRGRGEGGGDELGGGNDCDDEDDAEDERQAKEIRAAEDAEGYYGFIAARTAQKKAEQAAWAQAQKEAALHGGRAVVVEEEAVGEGGKRAITYAIEKNRGLAPRRKKEVRNPRVKKRKRFEDKKKKLASMKPVYRVGGEGRGGYAGELTGIKKGLVKSVKLS